MADRESVPFFFLFVLMRRVVALLSRFAAPFFACDIKTRMTCSLDETKSKLTSLVLFRRQLHRQLPFCQPTANPRFRRRAWIPPRPQDSQADRLEHRSSRKLQLPEQVRLFFSFARTLSLIRRVFFSSSTFIYGVSNNSAAFPFNTDGFNVKSQVSNRK